MEDKESYNYNVDLIEAIKIVDLFNTDLWEKFGDTEDKRFVEEGVFKLESDGISFSIYFLGYRIYRSDEDEREWIEEVDDYEPLNEYLGKKVKRIISFVNEIKL